ncbi:MAG: FKBP-type peptidyl-prolyl cis-trans isomerase [archaeon]|nr:FKBP-type peptidyl-prolyl cis-trans isomerase [archaeon]
MQSKFIFLILLSLVAFSFSRKNTYDSDFEQKFKVKHLNEGNGKTFPKKGDRVSVHYLGQFLDGRGFDSTVDKGEPFQFTVGVGRVIKCWDMVVERMSLGEKIAVVCPSELAYGAKGAGSDIPPNTDLFFEIELMEVQKNADL